MGEAMTDVVMMLARWQELLQRVWNDGGSRADSIVGLVLGEIEDMLSGSDAQPDPPTDEPSGWVKLEDGSEINCDLRAYRDPPTMSEGGTGCTPVEETVSERPQANFVEVQNCASCAKEPACPVYLRGFPCDSWKRKPDPPSVTTTATWTPLPDYVTVSIPTGMITDEPTVKIVGALGRVELATIAKVQRIAKDTANGVVGEHVSKLHGGWSAPPHLTAVQRMIDEALHEHEEGHVDFTDILDEVNGHYKEEHEGKLPPMDRLNVLGMIEEHCREKHSESPAALDLDDVLGEALCKEIYGSDEIHGIACAGCIHDDSDTDCDDGCLIWQDMVDAAVKAARRVIEKAHPKP
jgi:hypothetical protein